MSAALDAPALLGGFGGGELILIAAIALLLAGASRLTGFSRGEAHQGAEGASARAYLDRLLGPQGGAPVSRRATIHKEI